MKSRIAIRCIAGPRKTHVSGHAPGARGVGLSIALAMMGALVSTSVQGAVGFIHFLNGEGRVILVNGGERAAEKGFQLNEGDTVVTAQGATMQLRMTDDGLIAVRPDTRLRIDTYRYAGREDGSERGILELVRGGFRTITGVIGRANKRNLLVRAPSATIGIRGTDHEIVHVPVAAPGETQLGIPGTYNKVNVGETFMETPSGRLDLGPNQVGFAGLVAGVGPVRLESVPTFMRATPQQQGRDDRRSGPGRDSAPNDQRRIAQQAPPGGPAAQGRDDQRRPMGGPPQPPGQQPGQPPPPLIKTADDAIGFASAGQALTRAPDRYGLVGGNLGQDTAMGSGSIVNGESGGAIFFGQDGQPALIALPNGFSYARSGAHNIAPGANTLTDGTEIKWGIYAGGGIVDSSGSKAQRFFHGMGAQVAPLAVVNVLTGSYTTVIGQTKLITEGGVLGGTVGSANVTVAAGQLTGYNISVSDALARSWTGSCPACTGGIALTQFATGNVTLSGTGPGGASTGKAQGMPVGPTGAALISSFNLKTTAGLSVTGSFAAK